VPGVQARCIAGTKTRCLQCDAWLAASVASTGLHGNTGRPLLRQVQQRTAPKQPSFETAIETISEFQKV